MKQKRFHFSALSPSKILALGFLAIILLGSLLLYLPLAAEPGVSVTYLQALFTATSAVCVTGLTVVDTAASYSLFGELVILCLIQLGGLGFMMFATSALVLAKRRISLRNRMLMQETMNLPGLSGIVRNSLHFMAIVFLIEIAGAILLAIQFVPIYGLGKGLYFGVFHAISAFCNAGFDLFSLPGSLIPFQQHTGVLLTISLLIVLGGLGFAVIADVASNRFIFHKQSLHTKIVVATTLGLLAFGTVYIAAMEWNNPQTLAFEGANAFDKLIHSWFQSVTTRTAGYYSFQQGSMQDASKVGSSILMFIGASPASTGGGIKTTTLFVLLALVRSVFKGSTDVNAFKRRLSLPLIRTALSIFIISLGLLTLGSIILSLFEQGQNYDLLDLVFEEVSALATVGLSSIGTGNLKSPSQLWLILLMYFGRVGPLTMMLSFSRRHASQFAGIQYAEEQIYVG